MDLSKITRFFKALYMNLTAILFLAGLVMINIAIFMRYSVPIGLVATGLSLMFIAWLVTYESEKLHRKEV